jgi:Zn-dependent peptidase ImmA (M78 family)
VLIPTQVKVGSMIYQVRIVPDLWSENDEVIGKIHYGLQHIEIDEDLSDQKKVNTFFHELTHALLYEMGEIGLNDNERFVTRMGNMLAQVFKDNQWSFNNSTVKE